jgi:Mg2+ and Co2+ transporter CorA
MTTTTTIVTTIPTTTTIPQEKTETNFTLIFYGIVIVGLLIAASIYFSRKK